MGYRIKTVAQILGIPRNTLLAWERRYDLPEPSRQENGYREYSEEDLRWLKRLKRFLDQGFKVSEAVSLINTHPADHLGSKEPNLEERIEALRSELFMALRNLDTQEGVRILSQLSTLSYTQLINEIYFPILQQVGDLWAEGQLSVAEEHGISEFLRQRLLSMLQSLSFDSAEGPKALLACCPDEHHDIPLLSLAVQLALRGYRVTFLGSNLPFADIYTATRKVKPVWLCLSATIAAERDALLRELRALREAIPPETRIVLGGAPFREVSLEVDGLHLTTSVNDFLERIEALTPSTPAPSSL